MTPLLATLLSSLIISTTHALTEGLENMTPQLFPRDSLGIAEDNSSKTYSPGETQDDPIGIFEVTEEDLLRYKKLFKATGDISTKENPAQTQGHSMGSYEVTEDISRYNKHFKPTEPDKLKGNRVDTKDNVLPSINSFDLTEEDFLRITHMEPVEEHSSRTQTQTQTQKQTPEARLGAFVGYLKTFFNVANFNVTAFEMNEISLQKRLADIEKYADISAFSSIELKRQLRFAKYMFKVMAQSIDGLNSYGKSGGLVNHLVYCMIRSNVQLLGMFDSHGFPEQDTPGYAKRVRAQMAYIEFWRQMFDKLSNVSLAARMTFENQYDRAAYTLMVLDKQITNREGKDGSE